MGDVASSAMERGCAAGHCWLVGPVGLTRGRLVRSGRKDRGDRGGPAGLDEPATTIVDCRSASGGDELVAVPALVGEIVPWMLEHDPSGVRRTLSTVYTLAPGLVARMDEDPPPGQPWQEMTMGELSRLGHGLCELLHSWGAAAGSPTVVFEYANRAGTADSILIARVLREMPPELVRAVVCSEHVGVPDMLRRALTVFPRYHL